ncbi:MAG: hypothetical protein COV29_03545 [Candidatus Yanofskybacteria bacterium CG10_big_fil_rev_8_21_14_0_10_36_16]|uniref:Type II secretion system protein GspF domain-containing protein n=1 Tax=Candidatus Yanofskybacteria bacterium CG10_big_fil_rev_8_21_14_0_10_36_16 TaxID=1975096 RepID=A0A2J0Q742_9BACT|nr:MAG: hypothetical protein COV29_03545 [Candidatus Yanofskybacteria bacterium CG10_big_fil_rev_8_21_14_0_10_36_16]
MTENVKKKGFLHKEFDLSWLPFGRVSIKEQAVLAKRLSFLIKAGVPIIDGINMLKKQTRSRSRKRILNQILEDVSRGQLLSTSFGRSKKVFSEFGISMMKVGEEGGILDQNLNYLSEELKKSYRLRKKVKGALIYPAFVSVATILISGLITAFIFPKILPIFSQLGGTLPATTKAMIAISSFLINFGLIMVVAGFLGAIIFYGLYSKVNPFRYMTDRVFLNLPIFGKLIRDYQQASFCRTLGLLLKSQVDVVKATKITANTMSNHVYRRATYVIADDITRGKRISENIVDVPHLFSEMVLQTLSVGENTGNLSESLLYLSDYYENEVDELTKNLSSSLEPVLMVVMGFVVGFVAVSVITPIYQLTANIHP